MPRPIRQSATDACPGALRLHAAADGPLARVRLPGGLLTGSQLAELSAIAAEWGDGGLELTSRANLQLRALTRANPATLAARLHAAGLLPSSTHEVVRNIAAPPLADEPQRALVRSLDESLCADPALAALPGRFLFAIGRVPLAADLAATPAPDGFAILFAGRDEGLRVEAGRVVEALLAGAHAFLAERGTGGADAEAGEGKAWRLAEITDGPRRIAARVGTALGVPVRPGRSEMSDEPSPSPVGVIEQADGRVAVGAIVPLGRLTGVPAKVLVEAPRLVLTTARGVVLPDLAPEAADGWLAALAAAGLAVEAESRWTGVTACAGRPGCAKSLADVRADALAATRRGDGLPVHWVGCGRGCGSPAGPHVRVEATAGGYVVHGKLVAGDLGDAISAARRP
ncbi:precorrin-3B synthase [Actinoplanes sp. KI2]|uniref:precorrin-3B synthase n=1 Tax=Actinoplanes sp. KI2 TaxID=2983315 RepID=UPI0021D5F676|nr:precorrin-3B synthase [Actinoplanes sp. KI2]MCU7728540.1 precorrin-3B synthase [Actinoplanes sp. KI2]